MKLDAKDMWCKYQIQRSQNHWSALEEQVMLGEVSSETGVKRFGR